MGKVSSYPIDTSPTVNDFALGDNALSVSTVRFKFSDLITLFFNNIPSAIVTPSKISDFDWFKYIPGYAASVIVAGAWTINPGNTGTGQPNLDNFQSDGIVNSEVQYKFVLQAGTYKFIVHYDKDVNRGIYTMSLDGTSFGTLDAYSGTRVANAVTTMTTTLVVATSALHTLNMKMATRNASSAAYYATVYGFEFVRTA